MNKSIFPSSVLTGTIFTPADKSISHRAAILNALAEGYANINNYSQGADCRATLDCLEALGVIIEGYPDSEDMRSRPANLLIKSPGIDGLREPEDILDAKNSGTTMRLLLGILASLPFFSVITGDRSLRSRPMGRVCHPLSLMGAEIMGRQGSSTSPIALRGGNLNGIDYILPVASAQLKSALMLAAMFAETDTILHQPALSRDHTERMIGAMGASVIEDGMSLKISPVGKIKPLDVTVPGDISSAAFWMVAAVCHPNAKLKLVNVGINPGRTGIVDVLEGMGAKIKMENLRTEGGEPVADLLVESSDLHGIEVRGDIIPRSIDELPLIALAACFAKGKTVIRDAEDLRNKESDRISMTVKELNRVGARLKELPDGFSIEGKGYLDGGIGSSHGDHRLAMTLGIAGLLCQNSVVVEGSQVVDVSYPDFWRDMDLAAGNEQF